MIKKTLIACLCLYTNTTLAASYNQSQQYGPLYMQNHLGGYEEVINPFHISYTQGHSVFDAPLPVYSLNESDLTHAETESQYPLYLTIQDEKDWQYLKEQTYTIFGSCVVIVALMTLLPESTTGWDRESRDLGKMITRWEKNVSDGAQWDTDDDYLNYVMHPYFGGVYYTASRHAGYDEYESLLYTFVISTFFWEYGVEAFAERPSYQDLVITPLFGALVGEAMLNQEQAILANDGEVLGSETLGNISLFFLNPIGHIHHWATNIWGEETDLDVTVGYDYRQQMVQLNLELQF